VRQASRRPSSPRASRGHLAQMFSKLTCSVRAWGHTLAGPQAREPGRQGPLTAWMPVHKIHPTCPQDLQNRSAGPRFRLGRKGSEGAYGSHVV
jgi:hypothetical protein